MSIDEKSVSVIIPAFNEENTIGEVITSVLDVMEKCNSSFEVIIVDDGSQDRTKEYAKKFPVEIISQPRNKGYGASIKAGIRRAKYNYIILFDADGQHDPRDIPEMLNKLFCCDAVLGQRKITNSQNTMRMLGKIFLRMVASIILGINAVDLNCGFRAIRKNVIMKYLHLLPDGYSASSTTTFILLSRRYQVSFQKITASDRNGKSSLKLLRDGMRALNQIMRMSMLFSPWRLFGTAGIFSITLGAIYGFWAFKVTSSFPASAVMLMSSGISSIFFGLLMDQIAEIRKEKFE